MKLGCDFDLLHRQCCLLKPAPERSFAQVVFSYGGNFLQGEAKLIVVKELIKLIERRGYLTE
ncbi:hypothetical protein C5F53_16495 [Rhodoferax sp. TS-BS-61-7]|nr:hypothetical protein C5F53_16495 [Rhodoferax sp. TS-BS-61-7]